MRRRDHDTDGEAVQTLGTEDSEERDTEQNGRQLRSASTVSEVQHSCLWLCSQSTEAGGTIAEGDAVGLGVLVGGLADSREKGTAVLGLGHL